MAKIEKKARLLQCAVIGDLETIQNTPKEDVPEDILLVAALHNQPHVVKWLCRNGFDRWATAAISMACHSNATKALQELLDLKIRPDPAAMSNAIRLGWPRCIELLAGYNLPIDKYDICRAARLGYEDVLLAVHRVEKVRRRRIHHNGPYRIRALATRRQLYHTTK